MRRHRKLVVLSLAAVLVASGWIFTGLHEVLMTAAAAVAGVPVVRLALSGLMARQFNIPLLVSVAAAGAVWIGEPWEAAAVTFLYVLGSYLEDLTLERTRAALRNLVEMQPRTARVKLRGALEVIPADAVSAGQIIVVLPGDRIPADGTVIDGRAALNTAALTGEPLPAEVGPGHKVLSGSVSAGGYLELIAERVGPDTTFSRMIYLVAEAQEQKPRIQRFLDRFSQWYTPAVITAALLLYLMTRDLELALTFLVIGCPGALVVAAPVAIVAGLGNAARQGILIKGGERLERIGKIDTVAFDKTGTLTQGKPEVSMVQPFDGEPKRLVALAAAAEQRSEHHLATAILNLARNRGIGPAPASGWSLEPGLGAVAHSDEGEILVGSRGLLATRGISLSQAEEAQVAAREAEGETIALVALAGTPLGVLGITDPIRPEAQGLVTALKRSGVRHTVMLTGDNPAAAQRVARQLGLDEVRAGLRPEEKVAAIRELQAQGRVVAMVGDGINDAPALATADVAIAMGASGTQAAIEAADIALMSDRIEKVPQAIRLSRRIMGVVRQNVAFAVALVAVLLAGVVGRQIFLSSGMLIHEASVLLVIINGMRLLGRPTGESTEPTERRAGIMKRQMIMLENLNCPSCAAKLERAATKLPGMKTAKVAFGTGALTVEYDETVLNEGVIRETIQRQGLGVGRILGG